MAGDRVLERDSQLGALHSYAREAAGGDGRLVLVSGEAGIGKTTLVEECAASLPDATWWWGACDGLATPRPLGPLVDIAEQAGGELLAAVTSGDGREAGFDAFVRTLREGPGLRVAVVEDLHWADEATLDLLRFVGRRIRSARALLIATYRDDAGHAGDPLRATLGDLAAHRTTRRVLLGRLSEQAVRQLAAGRGVDPGSGVDAAEVHRRTGGNPFLVAELLAAGGAGIPGSVRDVVLARIAGIGATTRAVLDHAALLGSRLQPGLLRAASGASAEQLDELLASGVIVPDGAALRFRHEIARQAVAESVGPHRAAQMHAAILAALRAGGSRDDARLAFHADDAGDSAAVLEHAPAAARAASRLGAHREAAAQFERALRHAGSAAPADRAALLDELSAELALVERWTDAAATAQAAVDAWHAIGEALREGAAELALSTAMWRLCRGPEGVAARRRARELLEPLGPSAELCALYAIGADAIDADGITRYLTEAEAMSRDLGTPELRVRALNGVGYLAACRGADYETPLREAVRIALDHDLQRYAGQSYANLTEYLAAEFRLADAEPVFLEALDYCVEHDVSTFGNCVRGHYALALLDQGRYDEALRQAEQTLATMASPINRLTSLITAGLVHARRDDARAVGHLREAMDVGLGVDEPQYVAMARLAQAEADWLAGRPDDAREQLSLARAMLTPLEAVQLAAVLAWRARLGETDDELPALEPYAVQVAGPPRQAARVWESVGAPYHAALALGDSTDGDDLREAVRRLDALSPAAARVVRRRMRELGHRSVPVGARSHTRSDPHRLTRREREVLDLLGSNLTNEQIAQRLVVSVRTVDNHVSAVLAKLGVTSRREASAFATSVT